MHYCIYNDVEQKSTLLPYQNLHIMPAEKSVREQAMGIFGFLKKKPKDLEQGTTSKDTPDSQVEELERSLTKDDPLLESNTFNGDDENERKNNKNKKREEGTVGSVDEENKENTTSDESQLSYGGPGGSTNNVLGNGESEAHHVKWSSDVTVYDAGASILDTHLPAKIFSDGAFRRKANSILEKLERATSNVFHRKSSKGEATFSDTMFLDSYSSDKDLKNKESASEKYSDTSVANPDKTPTTGRASSSQNLVSAQESDSSSYSDDKTLNMADLNSGNEFQTVWRASSHTIKKIEVEQLKHEADMPSIRHTNSSGNIKEGIDVKDKPEDSKAELIEASLAIPPKKKKKWKGFRSNKRQDDSTTADLQTTAKSEETHQETSFIIEESKNLEEAAFEDAQPSTSRLDEEPPSSVSPPIPKPRKLGDTSKSPVPDSEEQPRPTRRRRRKRVPSRKAPSAEAEEEVPQEPSALSFGSESIDQEEEEEEEPEDDTVLGVTVHNSDHLRADLKYMSHPVVQVSLVDAATGSYLSKTNRSRHVTSYYEPDDVTSVLPIMTQPFDFRANQSVLPRWEETLVFNESFNSMVASRKLVLPPSNDLPPQAQAIEVDAPAPSPMLFFVIRDFYSMAKANNMRRGKDDDKGWITIAWAFLKLVGANGKPNVGRKVRLQLFYPPRNATVGPSIETAQSEPAFFWWRDHPRQPYQSTLYVTLKAVNRPGEMDPACRSMSATQPECGVQTFKQLHQTLEFADGSKRAGSDQDDVRWSRMPGQTCKVPNTVSLRLWSGSDGAFTVRFSNKGRRLAVACRHGTGYPILLYGIPYGEEMGVLMGHQQLVYDIHWSNDDERVVTSSGDGTAQVWDLNYKSKATHTLPHPAYVYSGAFHPTAQYLVATGGYDAVLRVWSVASKTAQILQELDGHKAFINSLAFDRSGLTLYSVDSAGMIVAWNCHAHEKAKKAAKTVWSLKNKFVEKELVGVCINNIEVHPGNNKLLLHCRDSVIRMFDVRIHSLLHYTGSVNHRQFMRSALAPCGSFVFSGSEDGCAYVWNAESGDQVAIYNELGFSRPVRDITYHPLDHLVAFCCFSPNMPVLVFKYDKDAILQSGGIISVVGSSKKQPVKEDTSLSRADSQREPAGYTGLKVERIKRQLDSVMGTPMASPRRAASPRGGEFVVPQRYDSYAAGNTLSTWGSTFDTATKSMIQPSFMSPHASPEARVMAQHLVAGQPKADSQVGWKPTFTAVGGSPYRSNTHAGPDVSFTVDDEGNKLLRVTSVAGSKVQHQVVALYGYQANRSDELTLMRGDVIKVLYKDGPTWWFGERISDGAQGYFPTNYVAVQEGGEEEEEPSADVLFGAVSDRPDSAQSEPSKTIHALKMGSKVHFYSQSESEDDDLGRKAALSRSSRQRRREKRGEELPTNVKSKNVSFTTPAIAKPSRQRSPRQDESFIPRKLPTLSPSIEAVEDTVTETEVAAVEVAPKPRKSRSKERTRKVDSKAIAIASPQESDQAMTSTVAKQTSSDSQLELAVSRQHFGVLKAIQAKMAEQPSFSDTVVVGPEFSERPRSSRLDALAPIMTSTSSKPKRSKSRASRSSSRSRTRPPKLTVTSPSQDNDDDAIPMLELGSPDVVGVSNLAYDDVTEM